MKNKIPNNWSIEIVIKDETNRIVAGSELTGLSLNCITGGPGKLFELELNMLLKKRINK